MQFQCLIHKLQLEVTHNAGFLHSQIVSFDPKVIYVLLGDLFQEVVEQVINYGFLLFLQILIHNIFGELSLVTVDVILELAMEGVLHVSILRIPLVFDGVVRATAEDF